MEFKVPTDGPFANHLADAEPYESGMLRQPPRSDPSLRLGYIGYLHSLVPPEVIQEELDRKFPEKLAGIQRMREIFKRAFPPIERP